MRRKGTFFIVLSIVLVGNVLVGCSTARKQITDMPEKSQISQSATGPSVKAGRPVVIYKTKKDYSHHVPVLLNHDKTEIISYPAVSDLKVGGKYPYPTPLANGYLLDNRGIGKNVAFLSYTYEEYAALPSTPSLSELMERIIDKNPLVVIHDCGTYNQYKNLVKELNERISAGNFGK